MPVFAAKYIAFRVQGKIDRVVIGGMLSEAAIKIKSIKDSVR